MVDMTPEELEKKTRECIVLLQELFLTNNTLVSVAVNAMFSLMASISMTKKEPFKTFEKRILEGIKIAKQGWNGE